MGRGCFGLVKLLVEASPRLSALARVSGRGGRLQGLPGLLELVRANGEIQRSCDMVLRVVRIREHRELRGASDLVSFELGPIVPSPYMQGLGAATDCQ